MRGDVVTFSHDFSRRIGTHDGTFAAQDNSQTPWKQQVTRATARRVPTNIVVHRIRTDVTWEDVLSSAGLPVRQFHNGLSLPFPPFFFLLFSSLLFYILFPLLLQSGLTPFQSRTRKSTTQPSRTLLVSYCTFDIFSPCFFFF